MPTNYQSEALFSAATVLYQTEASLAQHYETLRSAVTGSNLAVAVGVATVAKEPNPSLIFALVGVGLGMGLLTLKLSEAHHFHFALAAKMRGIIAKRHPKTEGKLGEVRRTWKHSLHHSRWIRHAPIWIAMNLLIPIGLAVLLVANSQCNGSGVASWQCASEIPEVKAISP